MLDKLKRIAEIEFSEIISDVYTFDYKMRLILIDKSYIDVFVSKKIKDRFGFHWERKYINGKIYRYDNYPDTEWRNITTYPYHFHKEYQNNVNYSPFRKDVVNGFRDFMNFVLDKIKKK